MAGDDQGTEPSAARRGDDLADIANQTGQHRKVREQRLVRSIRATFDAAAYGVWRDDDQRLSVLDQPTALRGHPPPTGEGWRNPALSSRGSTS